MTRSLDEIVVEYDPDEHHFGGHAQITVKWAAAYAREEPSKYGFPGAEQDAAAFGHPSAAEHADSALFVAGLLGRLAWAAAPWIAYTGQQHGCDTQLYVSEPGSGVGRWRTEPSHADGCNLAGTGLFNPIPGTNERRNDDWDGVELWFYVPIEDTPEWLAQIGRWLETLMDTGA